MGLSHVAVKDEDVVSKIIMGFQSFGFSMPVASHQANPAIQTPPSLATAGSKQQLNFKAQIPRNETYVFQLFTNHPNDGSRTA